MLSSRKWPVLIWGALAFGCGTVADEGRTVVVEGRGSSVEAARKDALRRAVEKALGEDIVSQTILKDGDAEEVIQSLASGYVANSDVLLSRQLPDGSVLVQVVADIRSGMRLAVARSRGDRAEVVRVDETQKWVDEATGLRRINADAEKFAELILDAGKGLRPTVTTTEPQRLAVRERDVVLSVTCTVHFDWKEWNRVVVKPLQRVLQSLEMDSEYVHAQYQQYVAREVVAAENAGRLLEGVVPCKSMTLQAMWPAGQSKLVFEKWRSERNIIAPTSLVYDAPPGVVKAVHAAASPAAGAQLVLEWLDKSGQLIAEQSAKLPQLGLVTRGDTFGVVATNGFIGQAREENLKQGVDCWRFELGPHEFRLALDDEMLARLALVRASIR